MSTVLETPVAAGARAACAAFCANGFAFASRAARFPQVRDRLELSGSELGLVLLAIAGAIRPPVPTAADSSAGD